MWNKFNKINKVTEVINSGLLSSTVGKKVEEFEAKVAEYLGVDADQMVAVNSGTAALHTLLLAHDIGEGDEVVVPAWTFISTASAVLMCGAKPVFADIGKDTFNITVDTVRKALTPKTRAVIVVHIAGIPAELEELSYLCKDRGILLLEDACQAFGATLNGWKVGTICDGGVYSFYPTKMLTTGEGGMIYSLYEDVAGLCRVIRNHGQIKKFYAGMLGFNYRMTEIQAALGIAGLENIDSKIEEQRETYYSLSLSLKQLGVKTPKIPDIARIAPTYIPAWGVHKPKTHNWYVPLYKLPLFEQDLYLENTEYAYEYGAMLPCS